MSLLDGNLLVALAIDTHEFHDRAQLMAFSRQCLSRTSALKKFASPAEPAQA
jgi:hypothetical protein